MNVHLIILIVDRDKPNITQIVNSLAAVDGLSCDCFHETDDERAVTLLGERHADVVFVGFEMIDGTDGTFLQRIRELDRRRPIVVIGSNDDVYAAVESMRHGAIDYVTRADLGSPRFERAIRRVIHRIRTSERSHSRVAGIEKRIETLTQREREVMELMVQGETTRQIANTLRRSTNTIKIHRSRVLRKMNAQTPAALTAMILNTRGEDTETPSEGRAPTSAE